MIEVDVLGSCVCRDLFRHQDRKLYNINRCFSNIPPSMTVSNAMPIAKEYIDEFPGNEYQKRMLMVQSSKQTLRLLRESAGKYLVIDLADELMKRFILTGTNDTQVVAEIDTKEEWYNQLYKNLNKQGMRKSPLQLDMEVYEQAYKQLAKELIRTEENPRGYEEKKIIVIESYYSTSIMGNDGVLHNHNKEWNIKEYNEFLKRLYMIFYKYVQNCMVIKLPEFTQASQNHLRGEHPLHYREDTYYYFLKALNVICGYSKINSIENLLKEQSLKNALEGRIAKCVAIYSLQDRVTKLEKK